MSLIKKFKTAVQSVFRAQHIIMEATLHQEMERLRVSERYSDPKSLVPYGRKIYSQCDEDGIINEIFRRIGTTNKTFVEFGVGAGLENNTVALLFNDWSGLWIEGSKANVDAIEKGIPGLLASERLTLVHSFITKANINNLIARHMEFPVIDLLSIDIDGNDYHILDAIKCVTPRVLVIEYNAKLGPDIPFCMDYNEEHSWKGDDCFGASLKFLEAHLPGFRLVGCSLSGANAFFVRSDIVEGRFQEPFASETHYEPARYYLTAVSSGQRPSYQTLENSFRMR